MIKAKNGVVEAKGTGAELLVDLSSIVYALNKTFSEQSNSEESKEAIMNAVERGFKTDNKECDRVSEILDELFKVLKGIGE